MWQIILKNRKAEIKTSRQIVRELAQYPNTSFKVKTLIVQNQIRHLIVSLTEKINKGV